MFEVKEQDKKFAIGVCNQNEFHPLSSFYDSEEELMEKFKINPYAIADKEVDLTALGVDQGFIENMAFCSVVQRIYTEFAVDINMESLESIMDEKSNEKMLAKVIGMFLKENVGSFSIVAKNHIGDSKYDFKESVDVIYDATYEFSSNVLNKTLKDRLEYLKKLKDDKDIKAGDCHSLTMDEIHRLKKIADSTINDIDIATEKLVHFFRRETAYDLYELLQ